MYVPLILTGAVLFAVLPPVPATPEISLNLDNLSQDPNSTQCYEKIRPDLAHCLTDARKAYLDKSDQIRLGKRGPTYRKTLAKGECVIRQAAIECILRLSCSKCNATRGAFGGAWYKEQTSKLKEECTLQVANVPECAALNVSSTAPTEMSPGESIFVGIMMAFFGIVGTIAVVGCMLVVAQILIDKFTSKPICELHLFKTQRKVILIIILFTASIGVLLLNFVGSILASVISTATDSTTVALFYFLLPTAILLLFVMCFFCAMIRLLSPSEAIKGSMERPPPVLPY